MVGPADIGAAFGKWFDTAGIHYAISISFWVVMGILLGIVGWALFMYFQYKYKVVYPIIQYDSDGNSAQIIAYKKDKARMRIRKGIKQTHFLWQGKWTEPIRPEDIKVGNRINLLRINEDGTYLPMPSFTLSDTIVEVKNKDGTINKVNIRIPHKFELLSQEKKRWWILTMKEQLKYWADEDTQKRMLFYTLIICIIGFVFAGLMIYFSLKYTQSLKASVDASTSVLQNIAGTMAGGKPN